jgi:hypothetical protein
VKEAAMDKALAIPEVAMAERPDAITLLVEGARQAAHAARQRWHLGGVSLITCIDEEFARYAAQLERLR